MGTDHKLDRDISKSEDARLLEYDKLKSLSSISDIRPRSGSFRSSKFLIIKFSKSSTILKFELA